MGTNAMGMKVLECDQAAYGCDVIATQSSDKHRNSRAGTTLVRYMRDADSVQEHLVRAVYDLMRMKWAQKAVLVNAAETIRAADGRRRRRRTSLSALFAEPRRSDRRRPTAVCVSVWSALRVPSARDRRLLRQSSTGRWRSYNAHVIRLAPGSGSASTRSRPR